MSAIHALMKVFVFCNQKPFQEIIDALLKLRTFQHWCWHVDNTTFQNSFHVHMKTLMMFHILFMLFISQGFSENRCPHYTWNGPPSLWPRIGKFHFLKLFGFCLRSEGGESRFQLNSEHGFGHSFDPERLIIIFKGPVWVAQVAHFLMFYKLRGAKK